MQQSWAGRILLIVGVAAPALGATAASAARRPPVRALHGAGACLALQRVKGCTPARGFTNPNGPRAAAISGDGRSLYIVSDNANAIAIIRINPRNGRLRQENGAAGCVAEHQSGRVVAGCGSARGFAGQTSGVAVSPDGRFVYVSSLARDTRPAAAAVAVFARGGAGRLHQLPGADGCVADRDVDGCTVVPSLGGYDISLDPAGERAYVGGHTFTVLARDPASGALAYLGCAADDGRDGCARTPFGLAVKAPTWIGGVGYASAFGPSEEAGGNYAWPLLALRTGESGLPELLPGAGGCRADVTYLRGCTHDGRLRGYLTGLIPTGDGDLIGFSSGEGEVPAPRGTPFQLWSVRLDAAGAMSAKGAHCLSTTRRRRCDRDERLLGGTAITGDDRRLYVAGERGVTAVARSRSGALRVLGKVGRLRNALIYNPTAAVITPDGRFVYVIAQSFYGTGSVKAYATATP